MHETLLSDEILNRILSYCLFIPPEVFLQFPTEARGNAQAYQTKKRLNYLLVSKRWLKIAKPLLYTSVILRKNAHTKAVAVVLQDCPGLSKKIDTLRLEGGYGRDFSYIVAVSPNIKHLYLNLELASSDTIAGMRKSLTTMDPTNFYAHQVALSGLSRNNQTVLELRAMMETCISSRWANLKHVYLCDSFPMSPSMATCLRKADRLEELHISTSDARKWFSADVDASLPLATIFRSPNLQFIRCRGLAEKEDIFACLASTPSLPPDLPLFAFEARPGEQDESGRYIPDLLEAAAQEVLASTSMPISSTAYNVRVPSYWQGPAHASGSRRRR